MINSGSTGKAHRFYVSMERNRPLSRPCKFRLPTLHKHLPGRSPALLLDIGCYDGSATSELGRATGAEMSIGIDFLRERLALAKDLGIHTVFLDVELADLPFPDSSIDFVYMGDIIEHVYSPDNLLSEVRRILSEDGRVLLTTPNLASWKCRLSLLLGFQPPCSEVSTIQTMGNPLIPHRLPSGHIRSMTPRALVELLSLNGFQVNEMTFIPASSDSSDRSITRLIDRALSIISPSLLDEIYVSFSKKD